MGDHKGIDNSLAAWKKREKDDPLVTIEVGPGRKKLIRQSVLDERERKATERCRVALHDVQDEHFKRHRLWYGEKTPPPVLDDYRSEEAKKSWPGYKRVCVNGEWREGPPPFKTYAEQRTYERTYGFTQHTGEKWERARESRR